MSSEMILQWGPFERVVDALRNVLEDPKELRPFSKRLRQRTKAFIESEGEGTWAPPAESTRKKWERTGTSDVTKHGEIRRDALKSVEKKIRNLKRATEKGGWGKRERAKLADLNQERQNLLDSQAEVAAVPYQGRMQLGDRKAEERLNFAADSGRAAHRLRLKLQRDLRRAVSQRGAAAVERRRAVLDEFKRLVAGGDPAKSPLKTGQVKSLLGRMQRAGVTPGKVDSTLAAGRYRLMPRMAGTISGSVKRSGPQELEVSVYSRAGIVGLAHDQGLGSTKKRTIIPEPDAEDLNFLADLLEGNAVEAVEKALE